ncbi:MAG TPA: type VI secretion system tube protein Hcp [Planctomycetota bacterium]|nr:type VI secretion system tube protein Hcp [Planctomycetota bacterium]
MLVYMKVKDISEVGLAPHTDWMLVKACSFQFSSSDAKEDGTERTPMTITKWSNRSSTKLLQWLEKEDLRDVAIEFCLRPGEVDEDLYILRFDLTETKMLEYNVSFREDSVEEKFQLKYKTVKVEYWEKQKTESWKGSSSFVL